DIKEIFDQSFPAPSQEQKESSCERVLHRLNSAHDSSEEFAAESDFVWTNRPSWRSASIWTVAAFAVLVLLSIAFVRTFISPADVYAIAETVEGSLDQLAGGQFRTVNAGERIDPGKILRTN